MITTTATDSRPNLSELKKSILASCKDASKMKLSIRQYEKFLFLIKKYPTLKAVPTKSIDMIWHYHLSDKSLYNKDCIAYFERIITHKQAFSKSELFELERNYNLTNRLWLSIYKTVLGSKSEMAVCGVDSGDDGSGGGHGNDDC